MVATRRMPRRVGTSVGVGRPLVAHWPTTARSLAVELQAQRAERDPSLGIQLLADVRSIFGDLEADRVSSDELVERLCDLEESRRTARCR